MNRKRKADGSRRTEQKSRLDSMFRGSLFNVLDRAAVRYDKYGFQRTAKVVRMFKKHAKMMLGGL